MTCRLPSPVQPGVRVVSASYGAYYANDLERAEIDALGQAGILFVAAAGNGGQRRVGQAGICMGRLAIGRCQCFRGSQRC